MTKSNPAFELYQHPEDYEALFGPGLDDLTFYREEAARAGGPVLDLGCGTGRLLWPLRQAGLEAEGLDSSAPMLELCRRRGAALGLSAPLHAADWRRFKLERRFKGLLLPFNGLQHLCSPADLDAFFGCLQSHLEPGGLFIFDVHLPQPAILARDPDERFGVESSPVTPHGYQIVAEQSRYEPLSQVLEQVWFVTDLEKKLMEIRLPLRQFYPRELSLLLSIKRFQVLKSFGDFKYHPPKADDLKQVLVCKYLG